MRVICSEHSSDIGIRAKLYTCHHKLNRELSELLSLLLLLEDAGLPGTFGGLCRWVLGWEEVWIE